MPSNTTALFAILKSASAAAIVNVPADTSRVDPAGNVKVFPVVIARLLLIV